MAVRQLGLFAPFMSKNQLNAVSRLEQMRLEAFFWQR
jgi:hypothetical protein